MKMFLQQACVLGGFYFIASVILGKMPQVDFVVWLEWLLVVALIAILMVLAFKKKLGFMEKFVGKYAKISNYLAALGVASYFGFFFGFIPGAIDGYFAAQASFMQQIYVSQFVSYLPIFTVLYRVVFWTALLLATYLSFIKPWIYKEDNKN